MYINVMFYNNHINSVEEFRNLMSIEYQAKANIDYPLSLDVSQLKLKLQRDFASPISIQTTHLDFSGKL